MDLKILHRKGKNSKLLYYLKNAMRVVEPRFMLFPDIDRLHDIVDKRPDKDYIYDRVSYYNKLVGETALTGDVCSVGSFHLKGNRSAYFFDTYEYVRYFDKDKRFKTLFGDITHVPSEPSIVKSRPLVDDNANSIVLNLDKCRHFIFLHDTIPFEEKEFKIIFRGECDGKERRRRFVNMYHDNELCDVRDICTYNDGKRIKGYTNMMSIYDHLKYKFIMSLEGNDVASNLKWVMSSNCIAVMPRPTCETWYMEGRLIPDYHYLEIKPDYSDLVEKTTWCANNPEKAKEIILNAHKWGSQFQDAKREKLISLLVLEKYFKTTK